LLLSTPQAQREHGNKWRNIAEDHLPWRSPNDLKNYWNQHVNGKQQQVRILWYEQALGSWTAEC
jgi:hypothetical protein